MKKLVSVLLLTISVLTINAQKKDPTLLTIGGKDVNLSEFNAIFNKNNSNDKATKESIDEYLELYIKFKLKVREAEDLGYDTLPKFINELKGYRKQLAQPYLTDKKVTEELIREVYDRMKMDVRASHILISFNEGTLPSDTLLAYNKAIEARNRIIKGEDFVKVAKELSTDPSAQKNGGDLGYFSALHMVYPFETAAFTTKVGDVSMRTRTRFGYHIIKVTDKRAARGMMKAAHIMVKADRSKPEEDTADKKQKIDEIYEKLTKENQDFGALAKQFSDDQGSARKGGELAEFNAGKMVEEFETAAFSLANDGDISKPVQSDFGWHIIKRISLKELESYEDLYNTIKDKVARDSRSNKSKEALLKKIKADNGFVEKIKERNDFYKLITADDLLHGHFKAEKSSKYNKLMFGFYAADGDKFEYTQIDFAKQIEKQEIKIKQGGSIDVVSELNRMYSTILEKSTIDFKDGRLAKTNDDFRLLMQEYRDGILLFDLTDEKVWSKAVKDSLGLYSYYDANKSKYMWGERVDATVYVCNSDDVANDVMKILKKKAKKGYSNDDILKMVNTDSQLSLKIEEGKYSKGDNEDIDKASWKKGETSTLKNDKTATIVEIKDVMLAEPKQLTEIKGLITSDYQNHLEKEWVESLRAKYTVVINGEVLKLVK